MFVSNCTFELEMLCLVEKFGLFDLLGAKLVVINWRKTILELDFNWAV